MVAITELLATLRGEEPPKERWDPAAHNQSKHGRFQATEGTAGTDGTDGLK
jgi:1-acyl-sn-glycerol-3-phosphate acyltransferase